jgi:hypothetical protein
MRQHTRQLVLLEESFSSVAFLQQRDTRSNHDALAGLGAVGSELDDLGSIGERQVAHGNPKSPSDPHDVQSGAITNTTLDPAHVAAADPCRVRKRLCDRS